MFTRRPVSPTRALGNHPLMMSGQNQLICVSVRGQNASSESGLAPTDCVCVGPTDRPWPRPREAVMQVLITVTLHPRPGRKRAREGAVSTGTRKGELSHLVQGRQAGGLLNSRDQNRSHRRQTGKKLWGPLNMWR